MKTAVVTGTSSGFGMHITIELAKAGWHVIATMRNLDKKTPLVDQLSKGNLSDYVHIEQLDVTDSDSIARFKGKLSDYPLIQLLVNNAGYAHGGFVEEVKLEEYRDQFETNFFGMVAVTQVIIPLMREQRKGTIVNISSISGLVGFPGLSPYVASKHAVEGFSESLRLELKCFGINTVLVEPGSYQTNIWSTGKRVSTIEHSPYKRLMDQLNQHIENGNKDHGNPVDIAKLIVKIAHTENPKLRYTIGKGVKLSHFLKGVIPWSRWEKLIFKKLNG